MNGNERCLKPPQQEHLKSLGGHLDLKPAKDHDVYPSVDHFFACDELAGFLTACSEAATALQLEGLAQTSLYPPVPMTIQRVANVERAQMLVESASRPALQHFLAAWQPVLQATREKGLIRWAVDVDPLAI